METKVGVKEFRAHLLSYLESVFPIAITRHGETIGYYIPAHPWSQPGRTGCPQAGGGEIGGHDVSFARIRR